MKKIFYLSAIALLLFATCGCDREENVSSEVKIIKELPFMYGGVCEDGKTVIVNSQQELENLFSELPKELTHVDFNKNTVVLGSYQTHKGVHKLEQHKFTKVGDKYEYMVNIVLDDTFVAPNITFGIIVEKIPNDSEIILKINLINN